MSVDKKDRQTRWTPLLIYLFLIIGIFTTAFFYYRLQQKRIVDEKQNELAAIADLKIRQITQWRNERLSDAEMIFWKFARCSSSTILFSIAEWTESKKWSHFMVAFLPQVIMNTQPPICLILQELFVFRVWLSQTLSRRVSKN